MLRNAAGILFVLALLVGACTAKSAYQKSYAFEHEQWKQNVQPAFRVEITDTTAFYDFTLTLRTTTDYKYSNLWIYLNTKTPSGIAAREPFEIKTTYPDGSWIGNKTGSIVEHVLRFRRRKMPEKGTYIFKLEQGITHAVVDEILDVSLIVEPAKKEN